MVKLSQQILFNHVKIVSVLINNGLLTKKASGFYLNWFQTQYNNRYFSPG
jgi:hypothetical protein